MSRLSKDERKRLRRDAERREQGAREAKLANPLEARDQLYERYFGSAADVAHGVISIAPHIDVYIYDPRLPERDFYTLVTSGLSEFQAPGAFGRTELIFYAKECTDEYISLLHNLAHAIIEHAIDLGHGHTITNGDPPTPLFERSELSCVLLHETGVEPECDINDDWSIDDEPVFLLNVMPITEAECDFIREHDVVEFSDILENHPEFDDEVFLGPRDSFV